MGEKVSKWHYKCENKKCKNGCEFYCEITISHNHGCPQLKWGEEANWANLGLEERDDLKLT